MEFLYPIGVLVNEEVDEMVADRVKNEVETSVNEIRTNVYWAVRSLECKD